MSRAPDVASERRDASRVSMPFAPGAIPRSESYDAFVASVPDSRASPVKSLARARDASASATTGDDERPRVMLLHCGGTLGMGVESFELREADVVPRAGGKYRPLGASKYLLDVQEVIPELRDFARLDVEVLMNKDSS